MNHDTNDSVQGKYDFRFLNLPRICNPPSERLTSDRRRTCSRRARTVFCLLEKSKMRPSVRRRRCVQIIQNANR